ncbi:quinone-dependent dihydroorotate dehydrogenase [Rubrivirga litoralis]|uniref:Dihydroorotate dehydrogenase (quinone) n=1 Tax=Rubrivirga litoralis TaxID=3075598 RepID=A0ABU3BS46_9BACT|nr:quinone-dependent dihydroorotate dehydrogenase [Rubrivirga sp. F394]MDT0632115.1 quinone-dependent dihydroorotate dehydrogenase [Rubrivirga sp. F394]
MYRRLRPLLFRLDAERAHGLAVRAGRLGQRLPALTGALFGAADAGLEQTVWGLRFRNPVGLAAGFDKNAELVRLWAALGFGHAEVGSVSARPSAGNARPRAFRLPADGALVNRMGLNNDGAAAVAARLAATAAPSGLVVGVNVAKTHSPDILGAAGVEDFRASVRALAPQADYLALNVSCPNTAEGKTFEAPDTLDALLAAVADEVGGAVRVARPAPEGDRHPSKRSSQPPVLGPRSREPKASPPLLVKLSPPPTGGVDVGATDELVQICLDRGVVGFITANTAADRGGLATPPDAVGRIGRGGLSGRPLAARATALARHLYRTTGGRVPIVGVGGVDSAEAAYARIRAGASLVQVYTGLVYEGPGLVGRVNRGLVRLLERDGFGSVAEAVGADA